MKCSIITTVMMPVLASGYSMSGHVMLGRPATTLQMMGQDCPPSSQPEGPFRGEDRNRAVDRSFPDLMNEIKRNEDVIAKSKAWVDRSFGLFSELNRDVVVPKEEVERNDEMLRKQQKWVNRVIDLAADFGRDIASTADDKGSRAPNNDKDPGVEEDAMSPPCHIKDGEASFQVAMELPGVKISDIDIRFDQERMALVISGQRQPIGRDRVIKFSKSFELDLTVDASKITATLSNGILFVTAPKKMKVEKDPVKKIPVTTGPVLV